MPEDFGFQLVFVERPSAGGTIQPRLPGLWSRPIDGCPHRHPNGCDWREMQPCLYELGGICPLFRQMIEEWREVYFGS
jgi:hypothetical protein